MKVTIEADKPTLDGVIGSSLIGRMVYLTCNSPLNQAQIGLPCTARLTACHDGTIAYVPLTIGEGGRLREGRQYTASLGWIETIEVI